MSDSIKITAEQFHKKFPCCSIESIRCSSCLHSKEVIIHPHSLRPRSYTWCQSVACPLCSFSWYICTSCLFQRPFTKEQLRTHHSYHHCKPNIPEISTHNEIILPTLPSSSNSSANSSANSSFSFFNEMNNNSDNDSLSSNHSCLHYDWYNKQFTSGLQFLTNTIINQKLSLPDEEHKDNFEYWFQNGKSIEYLLAKSCFNNISIISDIKKTDAQLNLEIFEFVQQLTRQQQSHLTLIFSLLKPYMIPSSFNSHSLQNQNKISTQNHSNFILPTSYAELRNTYLRGKNSMLQRIPQVPVKTHGKGKDMHSHVSVEQCLKHFLLFGGTGISNLYKSQYVSSFFESSRCQKLVDQCLKDINKENPTLIFPVVLFSDDFDPSVSLVKANNKAIWMYSMTFKTQSTTHTDISHTYILAIGNKGSNHIPILNLIEQEIKSIQNGSSPLMFHGSLGKFVRPIIIPILRHADQPERRSINMLKLGKETNHARWKYSLDIKQCHSKIPSCEKCSSLIQENILSSNKIFFI